MQWFVTPETVRLTLGDTGEWIDVKRRLTYGEKTHAQAALVKEIRQDGRVTPDFEMFSKSEALAYLLDWSLTDANGKRIPLETDAQKLSAIDGMHEAGFKLVSEAIAAHIKAQAVAEDDRKNVLAGATAS